MSEIAIKIEGLSKRYRIGQRKKYKTFRESIVSAATSPFRRLTGNPSENGEASFWAWLASSAEMAPANPRS